MKTVLHVVLGVLIVVMAYFVYESIQQPIRFNKEKDLRYAAAIQRLKDIRTAEVAFKQENKRYTADFDSLISFVKAGRFAVVRQIGDEDDTLAVKAGIKRDTTYISVLDSLYKGYTAKSIDSLRYVPFTNGLQFELKDSVLEVGKVKVQVFEASVLNDVLLNGLDKQLLINFNEERQQMVKFAGLKVGSVTETTNNAGNWE